MKNKIIGLVICILLISPFLSVAQPTQQKNIIHTPTTSISTSSQIDVPTWEIGNQWTYKIDNITISINQDNQSFDLYLTMAELPLNVISLNSTSYTLAYQTSVSGHSKIDADLGDGPINMTITFTDLKISGNVTIDKTTLGIKALTVLFKGRFLVDIIQQPYIQLPFKLPVIHVPVTMNVSADFDTPVSLLTFPLNTSMMWNSTATNLTMNGKIHSIWFNIILFFNNIAKLFNNEFLPPEIASLLPVVDIKEALTTIGTGNVFELPMIPSAFVCLNTENITVPAGTYYDAYNITILGGLAHGFYAPAAGNIVKLTGNFADIIPYVTNINMELLSTNYS
jgi:hypothetical protein